MRLVYLILVIDASLTLSFNMPIYRSLQAEVAAYNERERCFDDFSNLLRNYQVIARSDVDGSRTSAFWQTVLTPEGQKVSTSLLLRSLSLLLYLLMLRPAHRARRSIFIRYCLIS